MFILNILKWYSVVILSIMLIVLLGQDIENDKHLVTTGAIFIPVLIYVLVT